MSRVLNCKENLGAGAVRYIELARGVCVDVMGKDLMDFTTEGLRVICANHQLRDLQVTVIS